MYKNLIIIALAAIFSIGSLSAQNIFMTSKGHIDFFSETAIENIDAHSKVANMALNTTTGDVYATVSMRSFEFKKSLMQEHFNENYVESDKYPTADFTGHIEDKIDYTKDGEYKINIKGKFKIHGVEKERTIPAKITVKDGKITVNATFDVKLEDHNIDRPTVVAKQLADTIKVTLEGVLETKKK